MFVLLYTLVNSWLYTRNTRNLKVVQLYLCVSDCSLIFLLVNVFSMFLQQHCYKVGPALDFIKQNICKTEMEACNRGAD